MRTANLLLLLFEFFLLLCIHLYKKETFLFYLSFLLSFIIFVYYVFISLLKGENIKEKTFQAIWKNVRDTHQDKISEKNLKRCFFVKQVCIAFLKQKEKIGIDADTKL